MNNVRWLILLACAWSFAGCGTGSVSPIPYDRADALHSVGLSMGRLYYDDAPLAIHTEMNVRSRKDTEQGMTPPPGAFKCFYTLTMASGARHEYHHEFPYVSRWTGDLKSLDGGPDYLPPGQYRLSVRAVTPLGDEIRGRLTRPFTVRLRELKVGLRSDKESYAAGETIKITAHLTNLTAGEIRFAKRKPHLCQVVSKSGHDCMDLRALDVPAALKPKETVQLAAWEFVAGKADPRFTVGRRARWFPPPFGRKGTCRLEMSLSAHIEPPGSASKASTLWVEAVPGQLEIEITSVFPERRGAIGRRRAASAGTAPPTVGIAAGPVSRLVISRRGAVPDAGRKCRMVIPRTGADTCDTLADASVYG